MLTKLWIRYENYILEYSNNQLKSWYALFVCIMPFLVCNIIIGYFIWDTNIVFSYFILLFLSVPLGRLLYVYIIYKNNLYFGDGYNWYTLILFIFGMFVAIVGGVYLIIKDINEGFEKQQNIKVYKQSDINTNVSNNPNKYDYLIQGSKSNGR